MRQKTLFIFVVCLFATMMFVGAGCQNQNKTTTKKIGEDFFQKHCEYIFQKQPDMLAGWASNVDECVKNFISREDQAESLCAETQNDCDAARENRLKTYRDSVTKSGCLAAQKGIKCFMWDPEANTAWAEASAEQQAEGAAEFEKCMNEAETYCSVFGDEAPY
jgi:hypothetical protein